VSKDRTQPFRQGFQINGPGTIGEGPEEELPLGGEARAEPWRSVARLRDNAETASLSAKIDPALGQGRHILPLNYSRGSCSTGGASYCRNPTRPRLLNLYKEVKAELYAKWICTTHINHFEDTLNSLTNDFSFE
jgi:hypothetical protein